MNLEKEYQDLKRRLDESIKHNLEDIKESQAEIDLIMKLVDEHVHSEFFQSIAKDALAYARDIVKDGEKLIKASNLLK